MSNQILHTMYRRVLKVTAQIDLLQASRCALMRLGDYIPRNAKFDRTCDIVPNKICTVHKYADMLQDRKLQIKQQSGRPEESLERIARLCFEAPFSEFPEDLPWEELERKCWELYNCSSWDYNVPRNLEEAMGNCYDFLELADELLPELELDALWLETIWPNKVTNKTKKDKKLSSDQNKLTEQEQEKEKEEKQEVEVWSPRTWIQQNTWDILKCLSIMTAALQVAVLNEPAPNSFRSSTNFYFDWITGEVDRIVEVIRSRFTRRQLRSCRKDVLEQILQCVKNETEWERSEAEIENYTLISLYDNKESSEYVLNIILERVLQRLHYDVTLTGVDLISNWICVNGYVATKGKNVKKKLSKNKIKQKKLKRRFLKVLDRVVRTDSGNANETNNTELSEESVVQEHNDHPHQNHHHLNEPLYISWSYGVCDRQEVKETIPNAKDKLFNQCKWDNAEWMRVMCVLLEKQIAALCENIAIDHEEPSCKSIFPNIESKDENEDDEKDESEEGKGKNEAEEGEGKEKVEESEGKEKVEENVKNINNKEQGEENVKNINNKEDKCKEKDEENERNVNVKEDKCKEGEDNDDEKDDEKDDEDGDEDDEEYSRIGSKRLHMCKRQLLYLRSILL